MTDHAHQPATTLKRSIGLIALIIYGVGDILGAGIYALIGKIAAEAGTFSWASFAVAMVVVLLTALSYAELTRRHPHSGGASYFTQVAFEHKGWAFIVGWLLLCVSMVSVAALSRAFVGYAQSLGWNIPDVILIALFLGFLTLINWRGIQESSMTNIVSTAVETFGLLVVVTAGIYFFKNGGQAVVPVEAEFSTLGILQGAALAFYAFIGFEDLANIADEVKNPRRNLPIAIVGSLLCAGVFYISIGWLSTRILPVDQLAHSPNPLTEIVAQSGLGFPLRVFAVIALFAVANTCLLNFITCSRLLYGMAVQRVIPPIFQRVHEKYRTPYVAILAAYPIAVLLASVGNLKFLASTTSVLILVVFCATNFSLIRIKKKEPRGEGFGVPVIIPWLALVANVAMIGLSQGTSLLMACGFFVLGILVYLGIVARMRPAER